MRGHDKRRRAGNPAHGRRNCRKAEKSLLAR
jgi:hypothetical protein